MGWPPAAGKSLWVLWLCAVTLIGYEPARPAGPDKETQQYTGTHMSGGHGHVDSSNKKIALLVAVLAALLAISEMGGKSSQTNALTSHIDASNLWSFFQAKTIRQTTLRTAAEEADATFKDSPQGMPAAMKAQSERWRQTAQRYETEPETGEGRKELMGRARAKEQHRDKSLAAYHMFEYASAAYQLAIVLAGAAALTSVIWLTAISLGLGIVGLGFTGLAFFAPTLIHL
jgi:Domain of unknown function (DUF4337)